MEWTSIIAIFALFWVISAFLVLPFGVKTHDELGIDKVRGQADSAPGNFRPVTVIMRTTLLALTLFGIFYANYIYGWITAETFDFIKVPKG